MGSFDRGTGGEDCPRSCNTSPFRVEELGVVAHVSDPLGIARQTYDLKSLADTVDARYGAAQVRPTHRSGAAIDLAESAAIDLAESVRMTD